MGRAPCCDKANVKKGPWSPEEDAKLKDFIEKHGTGGNWIALPQKAGLRRCGKSCRLRWLNYLRPNIRHGEFSDDEDSIIYTLYASIGSRWSVIAAQLPGRTDNDIKNYWNTKLKKKLMTMLPSLQEKPTFFPSMPFQQPLPPSNDHQTSHQFLNNSSSFYNTFTPNYMNVGNNTSSSLFVHDNHNSVVTDLHSSPPQLPMCNNNVNVNVNDNCFSYIGFQDDQQSICNSPMQQYYYPLSACSSSQDHEGKQKYQIKQEDYQITYHDHGVGNQIQSQSFMIKNHVSPLQNDLEDVKEQLNFSNYLFHDGDENKSTHYQKGMCSYY
ncbi:uncharacterized protein LOC143580953 [Bidens hawaiensis]|uniref:uncharacterized protein LOC143580953 n=1 Tax=Bidens hawaiensis TaxID=980011 RepID=UPI00404A2D9D